jgi:hypothetical protein
MAVKCEYQLIKSDFITSRKMAVSLFFLNIIHYLMFTGRFHPFYWPRRPLGRVEVYLESVFRPRHKKGVRGRRHAPAAFFPGKDLVPIVQEAGWAPGPVWTGVKNLAPTGIRSPNRPART